MDITGPLLRDTLRTFRMAYFVPLSASWNLHEDMDLYSVRVLSRICMDLSRSFLIEHIETRIKVQVMTPYSPKNAAERLNLFYNRLSDRTSKDGA